MAEWRPRTATVACNLCRRTVLRDRNRLWQKDGYDIARCPSCGLIFRFDAPTAEEIEAIYGPEYFGHGDSDMGGQGYADYVADARQHVDTARRRVQLLSRRLRPGTLLDVGAAAGFFVAEARNDGWDARGIDVSAEMVEWGRTKLEVPLERQAFADAAVSPASLDAVTMWDYLEHTADPRGELEHAAASIRAGGVLALSTGDVRSLAARVSGRRWHLLTPRHHNFFFSRATLRRYLNETGFDIVESRLQGGRYSLGYLAHKLRTLADVAPVRAVAAGVARTPLATVAVPVNLFDIVTILAVRR